MVDKDASDLHLTVGAPPRIRINGKLINFNEQKLLPNDIKNLLNDYLDKEKKNNLEGGNEIDFSIGIPGISRFRVNIFKQRGNLVATFRRLPYEVPNINSLGFPDTVINLTKSKKGLILITGGTGSGKSTTLAALIEEISNTYHKHIVTIEDPIEYLYNHSKSLVNQREVGTDTKNFSSALRSVLRQDPDVVAIGELRDLESMSAAITIAETGHLVLGTLHTNNASGTITRLVDAFPPEKQNIIRTNLSMSLLAILSQQLIPNLHKSRSLALEILINTPSIKALIRENNIHQLDNYILSGSKDGMIKMDDSILELFKNHKISKEEALNYAINPSELNNRLNSSNL
tara:strand:- start:1263 stop:2297 length:1035 start_codon:yes stop_codon:yes gene_type:complete